MSDLGCNCWKIAKLKNYCHICSQQPLIYHLDVFDQYSKYWHRVRFFLRSGVHFFLSLLPKARFIKYDIWWLILEAYLEPSRTSTMNLFFAPLNTVTNFCLDISKLKLMTFRNFFSRINFSYQYPPEAKA